MHTLFSRFRSLISVVALLLLVVLVSVSTRLMQAGGETTETPSTLGEQKNTTVEVDPSEQEPPYDTPPPREWVALELDIVSPEDITVGLGGNVTIVVDVYNWGNVAADNVQVRIDGTDAYRAAIETIDTIDPGKHAVTNVKLDLLGRFNYKNPVYVIAKASNSPSSNMEVVSLSFNKLKSDPYFGKEDHVNLVVERFLKDVTALAEKPTLLQFELLEGFPLGEPFSLDLSELVTTEQSAGLNLELFYAANTGERGLLPITWEAEILSAEFTPPANGMYTLRSVTSEEGISRNAVSTNPIPLV